MILAEITPTQIDSALLAAHNIARALGSIAYDIGWIAFALFIYPLLGGFGSQSRK
jgi:hypothetical protein